jgi:hypothetical protein
VGSLRDSNRDDLGKGHGPRPDRDFGQVRR